jgi:hypothetical protein
MPTTRPRHAITETVDIAQAVDDAAACWPELAGNRAALLRRLVAVGHRAVRGEVDERLAGRRAAIGQLAGSLPGVFPEDAASALKAEWPE